MRKMALGWALWLLLPGGCARSPSSPKPSEPVVVAQAAPAVAEDVQPPFPAQFVDVTSAAGLRFRHDHGGTGNQYFVEIGGAGGGFFDYDGDGRLDIYLINGSPLPGRSPDTLLRNALYRNLGDGIFTDVTDSAGVGDTGYGMGMCVGDYDNDGDLDLYVTNWGQNVLYRNNGDGTLTDVTEKAGVGDPGWSSSATFLDYDLDGHLDLYVAHYAPYAVKHDIHCVGAARQKVYCDPELYSGESDRLYRNQGDGAFTDVTQAAGLVSQHRGYGQGETEAARSSGLVTHHRGFGVAVWDFDRNGYPDIYVANDLHPNDLWRNNGDGTFTEIGMEAGVAYDGVGKAQAGMGADWGDFDGDGDFDLIVGNFSNEYNTLYQNSGDGSFWDATAEYGLAEPLDPYVTWGTVFFDADLNGSLDLFFANGLSTDDVPTDQGAVDLAQRNLLLANQGEAYAEVTDRAGPGLEAVQVSRGAAVGDYDNDGDLDLLVTNWNDTPSLLRNDYQGEGHWVSLELRGRDCPSTPLGAWVEVEANGRRWVRALNGATSYLSQHDLRLHVGLGDAKRIDTLSLHWPCGRVSIFEDVAVDTWYRFQEGEADYEVR